MVSRAARNFAVFVTPLAIGSVLLSLAISEENPKLSKVLQAFGFTIPVLLLTVSAFLPEEVER